MKGDDSDLIIVSGKEAGTRLDKILAERFQEIYSRTYFERLIEGGRVLLNGQLVKKRILPQEGDEIEIEFLLSPELNITPENIPLDLLYEDEDILAVNKPAGMVVHPATGHWSGTFVNALLYYCRLPAEQGNERPGIVHRLDKDTTGVLLAAKNPLAGQKLISLFASREVKKEYLAICVGNPGNREVNAPIGRHPISRKKMAVLSEGGKMASTTFKTLFYSDRLALVKVLLGTGRTHQIRVHLQHTGTPVLGDPLYGSLTLNKKWGASRQLLHAYRVSFKHPISNQLLEIKAPLPQDIQEFMKKMKCPEQRFLVD